VKYGKNHQCIRTDAKVHREWKSTCNRASNITEYHRIALGCSRGACDSLLDLADEFVAEPGASFSIPSGRILELAFRSAPENDAKRH